MPQEWLLRNNAIHPSARKSPTKITYAHLSDERRVSSGSSLISTPSTNNFPDTNFESTVRNSALIVLVFPDPVRPHIPTLRPPWILNDRFCSAGAWSSLPTKSAHMSIRVIRLDELVAHRVVVEDDATMDRPGHFVFLVVDDEATSVGFRFECGDFVYPLYGDRSVFSVGPVLRESLVSENN